MIIINQNKDEIVNFNKAESIWICPEEGKFTIEATANTNTTLGCYKTVERAKEVLQEIIKKYLETGFDITNLSSRNLPKAFYMPED